MASAKGLSESCQGFFDRLKCHICGSRPEFGKYWWYTCLSDHKICRNCKVDYKRTSRILKQNNKQMRLSTCTCDFPIGEQNCKIIEDLLKSKTVKFPCPNAERGCQEILAEEAIEAHDCVFRAVECPRTDCSRIVPYFELIEHMKDKCIKTTSSLNVVNSGTMEIIEDEDYCLTPLMFELDRKNFVFTGQNKGSRLFCWVQLIGPKIDAKNYYYTVEFHGNDSNVRITYSGPVLSIDENCKSIYLKRHCFGIEYHSFMAQFIEFKDREKRYFREERFKVTVNIRNMKEESKDDNYESGISDDE